TVAAGAEVIDPSYLNDAASANGVSYPITPSALVDSVALINLSGVVLYVKVETTTEGIVYERRLGLSGGLTASNWWNYYFDPVERDSQAILTGFPVGLDATIHVAVSTDSGDAEIGAIILGRINPIGCTQYGSGFGIKDHSVKATDEIGNTSITKRGFSRRAELDVSIESGNLAAVDRILTQQRATPTVYIGDEYDPLVVYGFPTDWFVTVASYPLSDLTISLEGLT
ncbi:hypothetical protein, partial [Halomonas sp.]|uniref:hypothetical protein n=1 Tax=Halomonas sp. TaxID=1486246 RepID=UPI003D140C5C